MTSNPPRVATALGAVVVLCLVQFVDVLGVTGAIVAIPAMLQGVGASASLAGPIATAYAMFFGGLLVLGARLGYRFGHRRMLLIGLVVFALGGGAGALATSGWHLVAARSIQGAASALSVPAALNLILATAREPSVRRRALALWSVSGAAAGASGFFVGGLLTDAFGWQAVFWITIPVGVILCLGVLTWVHVRPYRESDASLDLPGAGLLTVTMMGLVFGAALLERPATRVLGALVVCAGLLGVLAFVSWLRHARDPIIPPAALRQPRLAAGALGSFVTTGATSSSAVLLALFLQREQGLGVFAAGLLLVTLSVSVIPGSTAAAPFIRRWSPSRAIVAGLVLIALGNLVTALTLGDSPGTIVGFVVLGLGLGLASVGCNDLGTAVEESHVATAIGVLNTGAQLGTALGVAALALVASPGQYGNASAVAVALLVAAAGAAITAAVLTRWPA